MFTFELFPNYTLHIQLFTQVTNSPQLRQNLKNFNCAFIDPKYLVSVQHLTCAANRAISNYQNNCLKTASIFYEIIYYLSDSGNVTTS